MRRINSRILALMGLMLGIGLWLSLVQSPPQTGERLMQTPQVPAAQQVEVGLHVSNVYNLSLRDKTFSADGWYWLKWPQAVQDLIERDQIPINELVEFPNQVEHWDSRIEGSSTRPERTPDGRYLQVYQFSGNFYDNQQNLSTFPYQQLELPINIETFPTAFSMADHAIVLRTSIGAKEALGEMVDLNGYIVTGVTTNSGIHRSSTTFGESTPGASDYSQVSYTIHYRTNGWSAFYTYMVPWIAVMAIVLLAPSLDGKLKDQRLAIPSTTLLTFVFLRISSNSDLPPLDYITFMDKLYILGFAASAILFCLFAWGSNLLSRSSNDQLAQAIARINQADAAYQISVSGGLMILIVLELLLP